jgi:hypothetical protein
MIVLIWSTSLESWRKAVVIRGTILEKPETIPMSTAFYSHTDCRLHDMGAATPNARSGWTPSTTTCWPPGWTSR